MQVAGAAESLDARFDNQFDTQFGGEPLDVERRLVDLVRNRGALRCTLAALATWLVARRGWERLGYARLRDYANERVGLSARSLQDLARVGSALLRLPRVQAALIRGELNWTKVRLLARVATPDDEEGWVSYALGVTARALAREVRAVDVGSLEAGAAETDEDGAEDVRRESVQIRCTPDVNARWYHARRLARRVAGEPLPIWGCMELIAAEVISATSLEPSLEPDGEGDGEAEACNADGTSWAEHVLTPRIPVSEAANGCAAEPSAAEPSATGPESPSSSEAPDLPVFLKVLVEGLDGADAFELDRRLRCAVALEQRLDAEIGARLASVAARRLYRALGFSSLEHYARERLGVSPRKARALLRLERAAGGCAALGRAYRDGELSWVQAQTLIPLLLSDEASRWGPAWVDWARRVSVRRLQDDVDRALVIREIDLNEWLRCGGLPASADRQMGARQSAPEETSRVFFIAPRDVARLFRAVLCTVRRRIERETGRLPTEGQAFEVMLEHVFAAWGAQNERVRREHRVFDRDGWRCTVPGCSSRRNLHDHHIVFRAVGGNNELGNRTTLCAWHHLRGVHAGIVRCVGDAPDQLRFDLGVRSGGPPLVRYRSGDLVVPTAAGLPG
jgi:hypothetical protein